LLYVILSHFIAWAQYAMLSTLYNCIFSIKDLQGLAECIYMDCTNATVIGTDRTDGEYR